MHRILLCICLIALFLAPASARGEGGYELWLRYARLNDAAARDAVGRVVQSQVIVASEQTAAVIADELSRAVRGMTGKAPRKLDRPAAGGSLIVAPLDQLANLGITLADAEALAGQLGREGYLVRTIRTDSGASHTLITANSDRGLLYGTFALLRQLQTSPAAGDLDIVSVPRIEHRVLQHWDNMDGSTERVYSEDPRSIWWNGDSSEPAVPEERWRDYGRACASIGINTVVINNVNASTQTLLPPALKHTARIADVLRPYGIRVALSANFAAPLSPQRKFRLGPGIGTLDTADPTDPRVINWWDAKIAEIYELIPDFAGFLVKAGAEGMPGPESSGGQASTGANMLGRLLAPRGGILMWRTFTWDDNHKDLVQRQYIRFAPQDSAFERGNIFLQSKYGPRDFMPREPFHPLFGEMTHTQLSLELQITQEYTGHDKYLMYWGPLWQEILRSDTHAKGEGSTVARVIDGSLHGYDSSQIAGVANISRVRNWTGHPFAQANWYAFGRFAWDPEIDAAAVAEEWIRQTWGNDPAVVEPLMQIMMASHETMVNYVGPLGIGHTNTRDGHHYEPEPHRDDYWQKQFINAKADGIGHDRTQRTGTGATAQYQPAVAQRFENLETCPENLLLWFHHVPWTHRLLSGQTVWETLVSKYNDGVETTAGWIETWKSLRRHIDAERHQVTLKRLETQHQHARKYRRLWLTYFQQLNGLPLAGQAGE